MVHYYRGIEADASLNGKNFGVIRSGKLFVAPEIFSLLGDDDLKDVIMEQLKIEDELNFGKMVSVFDGKKLMGSAIVTSYPMEGAKGFAMVKFFDKKNAAGDFIVAVERIKCVNASS
jgi:hypothetical protein